MNDYLRGYLDGIRDERDRRRDEITRALQDCLLKLRVRPPWPREALKVPDHVPDEWTQE